MTGAYVSAIGELLVAVRASDRGYLKPKADAAAKELRELEHFRQRHHDLDDFCGQLRNELRASRFEVLALTDERDRLVKQATAQPHAQTVCIGSLRGGRISFKQGPNGPTLVTLETHSPIDAMLLRAGWISEHVLGEVTELPGRIVTLLEALGHRVEMWVET